MSDQLLNDPPTFALPPGGPDNKWAKALSLFLVNYLIPAVLFIAVASPFVVWYILTHQKTKPDKSEDITCVTVNGVTTCSDTPADTTLLSRPENGENSVKRTQTSTSSYPKGTDSKRTNMSYQYSSSGSTGY